MKPYRYPDNPDDNHIEPAKYLGDDEWLLWKSEDEV
jgi:hypothetical protein